MKKLDKMYLCYLGDGSNCLYCNPTTGRAEADEVKVILPESVEIVTMVFGMRIVEYHNGRYPDNALYTEGNKVFTHTYQSGDVDGRPTGKPIMVAEMVEE